jgi:integral membrane protein
LLQTAIGRLRVIGFLEGISYLILLGIAMPLKYFAGLPTAVTVIGMAHGVLFVLFVLAVLQVMFKHRKSILWGIGAFVASLVPFGTFVLDAQIRKDIHSS